MDKTYGSRLNNERLFAASFLVISIIAYIILGLKNIGIHVYTGETDTIPFIRYAIAVHDYGSLANFIHSMFTGSFMEANQHPLFSTLISLFFRPGVEYFVNIKIFNLVTGGVFLILFYFLVYSVAGIETAALSIILLLANDLFMEITTMVSAEPVLIIFTTLAFYYIYRGLDDNRYWVLAGLFTGIAFLAKQSGLFIIFGFGIFLLIDVRLRFWKLLKNRYLWLFLLMFILVSLPLLVRNTIAFGFPFYNDNIHLLAIDQAARNTGKVGTAEDLYRLPLLYTLGRFATGSIKEFMIMIHSLYTLSIHFVPKYTVDTASIAAKITAAVLAFLIFASSVAGLVVSRISRRAKILAVILLFGFFLPLSWYSITSPNRRYILPVSVFMIVFASYFIIRLLKALIEKLEMKNALPRPLLLIVMTAGLALFAIAYPLFNSIPDPKGTYKIEDGHHEIARYLKQNLGPDGLYYSLGWHYYPMTFLYPELDNRMATKRYFPDIEAFSEYFNSQGDIKFILMQPKLYRSIKNVISPYIYYREGGGFRMIKQIPGWETAMTDDNPPGDFILLKRDTKKQVRRKI